jgi:ATP-dependent protease ClpP protease subunit
MRTKFTLAAVKAAAQKPFFKAALQSDGTLELLVYEEIGENWWSGGGVTVKNFKDQIDQAGARVAKILVRINSPGGDPFEGSAIYSLLRAQKKPIEVCVDGIAASAASIIAMAGDTIIMGPASMMMIHNASGFCYGFAKDMRSTAEALDAISLAIAQAYVTRTGKTTEEIAAMMDAETWMTAQQCLEQGFCTAIVEEPELEESALALARTFAGLAHLKAVPDSLKAEPAASGKRAAAITLELSADFRAHLDQILAEMKAAAARNSTTPTTQPAPANAGAGECECDCENCLAGDCENCENEDCVDPNCEDCPWQTEAAHAKKKAKAADDLERAKAQLSLARMRGQAGGQ